MAFAAATWPRPCVILEKETIFCLFFVPHPSCLDRAFGPGLKRAAEVDWSR